MPHGPNEDKEWPRLWDDPGQPADVRQAVGNFGALNQYATLSVQVVVAKDGVVDDRLVGSLMHPDLDGVMVATMQGTASGDAPIEEMTELLRELGWRWATPEEAAELWQGYLVPGLADRRVRTPLSGSARAAAARALT